VVTGDGLAAALRAGARLRDMEMMQFHPTTLYVAGAGRALISEAIRGEGAYLVDKAGQRFMRDFHADMELAPRDIVSRAIHAHLIATRANCVYLDVRHLKGFAERFPQVARLCRDFQIDVSRDLIPVRPSAHYLVGGVEADLDGRTNVPGLFCCGEAASVGVHGANRMASNSLLEGLVFGARAGRSAADACERESGPTQVLSLSHAAALSSRTALDLPDIRNSLRSVMWRNVGIVRDAERLRETCDILRFWGHYTLDKTFDDPEGWELQNMLLSAYATACAALERGESLGVHFRADAPEGEPSAEKMYHTLTTCSGVTRSRHIG
jgi:L-aspartate oxidase